MTKRILFAIIGIVAALGAAAQSAEGRYVSRMTRDGTLFFVMPHKLGETESIKSFEYDMTLLSWTDSVTVNFTFLSDRMERPTDLRICSGVSVFACGRYQPLYTDIKKNRYEIRITASFPVEALKAIINSPDPPVFRFRQEGEDASATYRRAAWRKDSRKLQDIFRLYEYSK